MTADNRANLQLLSEKIKKVRIAMLTTISVEGRLHSRPMATQETAADGNLWFFSYLETDKTHEILHDAQVNISYANPDDDTYVSVSGRAMIVNDKEKAKELWKPILKAWFPKGLDEPGMVLLKVEISQAEYWDNHQSKMVQLFRMAQSALTGEIFNDGEHSKIDFK